MNGKGSGRRKNDNGKQYRENYSKIFDKDKKSDVAEKKQSVKIKSK